MKLILALACATISTSALAEDVWVNRPALDIREGKGAAYNVVITAKKGDKLSIVAREGKWVKVNLNGKEGYVFENSLSATQVAPESMSNMSAEAKGMAVDAASKGNQPETHDYAARHNYSEDGLAKMRAMRKLITGKDFEQFTTEGKVGPAK